MRQKIYFFAKTLILLMLVNSAIGNTTKITLSQEENCNPPSSAWVDNVTSTSFDLFWLPVPTATEYQIDVFVNGTPVFSTFTNDNSVSVSLPITLEDGDIVEYQISTHCLDGSVSEPLIGSFQYRDYIGTVDIVMGLYDPLDTICDCSYIRVKYKKLDTLTVDCDCANGKSYQAIQDSCIIQKSSTERRCPKVHKITPLGYCSPNPFSDFAQINLEIVEASKVSLSIIDFTGKEVLSLVENEFYEAGAFSITFDGSYLERGIYYYIFQTENRREIKRILKH